MRLLSLQHTPFEGPANIEEWAKRNGHSFSGVQAYKDELPLLGDFDWLVVMGGPMSVHDEAIYPWLKAEKKFIRQSIATGKIVLGICLGAQLVAEALGASVGKNEEKEIGWYTVRLTPESGNAPAFKGLPGEFMAFHWHGDTFGIPAKAAHVASSEACASQAFELGRIIGLQFHLECSEESIEMFIKNGGGELVEGRHVQKPGEIRAGYVNLEKTDACLSLMLDNIEREFGRHVD
jgi:GMP synthase-like glutamine amidotransferase